MFPLMRTLFGTVLGGLIARIASMTSRWHGGSRLESKSIARRGFLRNAVLGSVVIVLIQIGFGFVRFFWPNKTGAFGKKLTVSASDVPAVNGAPFTYSAGKFFLVHTEAGLMALYWKCPHLGCTVPWVPAENKFHCPCHGSIYDYAGSYLGGPAPRSMDYFPITVEPTGDVIVDTGNAQERQEYDPSQATPI